MTLESRASAPCSAPTTRASSTPSSTTWMPTGQPRESAEFHLLFGIQRAEQARLAREHYRARVLISYGEQWFPWYMRRLAERPANVLFVAKSMLSDNELAELKLGTTTAAARTRSLHRRQPRRRNPESRRNFAQLALHRAHVLRTHAQKLLLGRGHLLQAAGRQTPTRSRADTTRLRLRRPAL